MTNWNPSAPAVVGIEVYPAAGRTERLTWILFPHVQRFRSSAVETIAGVRLHAKIESTRGLATYLAEIRSNGNEIDDGLFTVASYAPNVLTTLYGTVFSGAALPGPPSALAIDEWPPNYTDTVEMGPVAAFSLQFGSAAIAPTGRIANVGIEVVTDWGYPPRGSGSSAVLRAVVSLVNGGIEYGKIIKTSPNNNNNGTSGRVFYNYGEINPITGRPWTAADVAAFDTATTEVKVARATGDGGTWAATAIRLVVVYENTERRLAVGTLSADGTNGTAGAFAWTASIPLFTPAGVANWSKATATDYSLVVRQADRGDLGSVLSVANSLTLSAVSGSFPAEVAGRTLTVLASTPFSDGNVSAFSYRESVSTPAGSCFAFALRTTAPATSVNGQPYASVGTSGVASGGVTQQEITAATTLPYRSIRATVGHAAKAPTAPLNIAVRRRSDNVVMGYFVIPVAAVTWPLASLGVVKATTSPAFTLAAGIQYYFDLTTSSVVPWTVGALLVEAGGGGVLYGEATFGGNTDQADPIGSTASTALTSTPADLAIVLDVAVTPPGSVAAVGDSIANVTPLDNCGGLPFCAIDEVPVVLISWTATGLGASFGSYTIQRLGVDALTWEPIASITDETVTSWIDAEARISIAESYRMNVVKTDGASSDWTAATIGTAVATGVGYTFSSSEAPELSVGYADVYNSEATRDYDFLDEVTYKVMYGRDFQVGFRSLADRGVTFSRVLLIAALTAPAAGVGPAAAGALRALSRSSLSYVCVRDESGNRWFGSVTVPTLAVTQPFQAHRVSMSFVETTATPSTPDAVS